VAGASEQWLRQLAAEQDGATEQDGTAGQDGPAAGRPA
jgi:hypothetical protein